jgi:hypothetical protein
VLIASASASTLSMNDPSLISSSSSTAASMRASARLLGRKP